jgi:peptidoglycan hydrolase CwlO-like protein
MPDEEEGIYLLIELLKNRVARVEAENTELKDFKESHSQLKADHEQLVTDHKELEESHNQLITLNNQLEEAHGQLDTRYKELKEAHGQIQEDYEQFFAQFKELREFHSQLQEDHEQMVSHYNGLKEDHKQLASHYKELKKSHAHLDTQNKLLDSEKAQLVLEQAQWVSERRSIQEPTVSDIVQQHFSNSQNAKMPTHPVAKPTKPVFSVEKPTKPVHPVEKPTKPVHSVEKPTKPVYPVEKPTIKPATLSASARHVLDSLCPEHNAKNCMLCTRVTSFGDKTTGGAPIRSANPIPVSKRMPVATPYEDEPTIRPSVEPSLALSTVIKGLEDEIAHLKMRQSEVQKQYNSLDASLGKRERRRIGKELESLFQQLEFKGDQLYGLYDALEGLQ